MNQYVKYARGKIRKDCAGLDFRMWPLAVLTGSLY